MWALGVGVVTSKTPPARKCGHQVSRSFFTGLNWSEDKFDLFQLTAFAAVTSAGTAIKLQNAAPLGERSRSTATVVEWRSIGGLTCVAIAQAPQDCRSHPHRPRARLSGKEKAPPSFPDG